MIEYEFTYELPSGDELEYVVSIVPGVEAKVLCLPEDAEPAEGPEVHIEYVAWGLNSLDVGVGGLFIKEGDKFISLKKRSATRAIGNGRWNSE